MLQTPKRSSLAAALATLLLLAPALGATAAPPAGGTWGWGWLSGIYESIGRVLAGSGGEGETGPSMDPNGLEAGPDMDPDGAEAGPSMDPDGAEAGPSMDPDGYEAGPGMDPNGGSADAGPSMDPNG
jgi:hypothetical protein